MRVALVGISHWHGPMFYRSVSRLSGVEVSAVSDPNLALAQAAARELGARAFADCRDMLTDLHPDFVFVLGRHCDMAEAAVTLVEAGVPFVVEQPGGINATQVARIRDLAKAKSVYAGVGFKHRVSDYFARIQGVIGDNPITHASFRFVAGGPNRYRSENCAWMLDPELSGGGPTINFSLRFVDMFRKFSLSAPTEVVALMSHSTWNLPIEDYSSIILHSPQAVCTIETGYTFPERVADNDARFSIRTTRHYIVVRSDNIMEVYRASDGQVERYPVHPSNSSWFGVLVSESIDRFAKGLPPVASLDDLVDAMEVIDAAFKSNREGGAPVALGALER